MAARQGRTAVRPYDGSCLKGTGNSRPAQAHSRAPVKIRGYGLGRIADEEWLKSAELRSEVELDRYVVMPNHVHGLVIFQPTSQSEPRPARPAQKNHERPKRSLGSFMGSYKSTVTTGVNRLRSSPGVPVWQRNYWEHIVRSERALRAIRRYIEYNPARWSLDRYHPNPAGKDPMAAEVWKLLKESTREDPE